MKSYAKCNLSLNVVGLLPGGYHELDSVVCSVSLFDEVEVLFRNDGRILCYMDGRESSDNSAVRAAEAFRRAVPACPGMEIRIRKGIPERAGLGGSSADAAAVFRILGETFSSADVLGLSETVGSDTRYQMTGGFARMRGRGERVETFCCPGPRPYLVFCMAEGGVSTAEAFRIAGNDCPTRTEDLVAALKQGDWKGASRTLGNGLFRAARTLCPGIGTLADRLRETDPLAVNMTGSGSGVYALFEDESAAKRAAQSVGGTVLSIL